MTNTPRSNFAVGSDLQVVYKGEEDNSKCAVDIWAIKMGKEYFLASLIMPMTAPEGARWLLGSITAGAGDSVWGYRDDTRVLVAGFDGHIFTLVVDEITQVVYATRGKSPQVAHVVPLVEILQQNEVEVALDVQLARKRAAAEVLGYDVQYTATESVMVKYLAVQEKAARAAERAADVEAREAARQAKVDGILARKHLRVFAGGKHVEAVWVIDGEWQMLPPKTPVILGEFRQENGKELFYPLETFVVYKDYKKRGSAPEKSHVASVDLEPAKTAKQLPQPIMTKVVILKGRPFEVPSFGNLEDIQAHRKAGLNSGALRGVLAGSSIDLYRVRKDGLEQVAAEAFTVIG